MNIAKPKLIVLVNVYEDLHCSGQIKDNVGLNLIKEEDNTCHCHSPHVMTKDPAVRCKIPNT